MNNTSESGEKRVATLERSLHRAKLVASLSGLAVALVLAAAFTRGLTQASDEVRTHRLVIVDDQGHPRAVLGQDRANAQRVSRGAGLTLYDDNGSERGGFGTMADGSVVLGLDAPAGVGAPMRDRIGLKVFPNGSAYVMLIDNKTGAVARLLSEEGPGGIRGVQVFKWQPDGSRYYIRTITFDGDVRDSISRR